MMNRVELSAGKAEQVSGGMSFACPKNETEMMAELRSKAEDKFELTDEQRERFERFKDVFI